MSNEMTIQPKRKVTVFSARTNKKYVFESAATTYGELKVDMAAIVPREDMNLEESKVFEGFAKVSFESDASQLPVNITTLDGLTTNDLTLIVTPKQRMKSGATLSRPQLYAEIKTLIAKDGDKAKNHFNAGKNYTNKSTDELQKLYDQYMKKNSGAKPSTPAPAAKPAASAKKPEPAKPAAKPVQEKKEKPAPVTKEEVAKTTNSSDSLMVELSSESLKMIKEGLANLEKGIALIKASGILPLVSTSKDLSIAELQRMAASSRR